MAEPKSTPHKASSRQAGRKRHKKDYVVKYDILFKQIETSNHYEGQNVTLRSHKQVQSCPHRAALERRATYSDDSVKSQNRVTSVVQANHSATTVNMKINKEKITEFKLKIVYIALVGLSTTQAHHIPRRKKRMNG